MSISKNDVCNLALGHLGSKGSIEDIDSPKKAEEIIMKRWYDLARRKTLKLLKPNFSLKRSVLAVSTEINSFGFSHVYILPSDCLSALGIGNIEEKENNYTIEGGRLYTDETYTDGLPLRYVKDEEDTTKFSPEFVDALSWQLAYMSCMSLTQSKEMLTFIAQTIPSIMSSSSAMNAQENRMIRISNSKFKAAKLTRNPSFEEKK